MFAWFSQKQAKLGGVVRYRTANGSTVDASAVAKTKAGAPNWDDVIYLGEVTDYVCRLSEGEMGDMEDDSPEEFLRKVQIIHGIYKQPEKSKLN